MNMGMSAHHGPLLGELLYKGLQGLESARAQGLRGIGGTFTDRMFLFIQASRHRDLQHQPEILCLGLSWACNIM